MSANSVHQNFYLLVPGRVFPGAEPFASCPPISFSLCCSPPTLECLSLLIFLFSAWSQPSLPEHTLIFPKEDISSLFRRFCQVKSPYKSTKRKWKHQDRCSPMNLLCGLHKFISYLTSIDHQCHKQCHRLQHLSCKWASVWQWALHFSKNKYNPMQKILIRLRRKDVQLYWTATYHSQ